MIEALDQILTGMLDDPNAPSDLVNAAISFRIPNRNFAPANDTINLYLYDVHENLELRDPVPIIEQQGDTYVRRKPPIRVDCSFMVTAWSTPDSDTGTAQEHHLLSLALLWLSQYPKIPEKYLPVEWKQPENAAYQPFPPPMFVGQINGVKEPGEFWAALEQPPRPFFNVVVTIAMDFRQGIDIGPPVTTKEGFVPEKKENFYQIGGRVYDANYPGQGIEDAVVVLTELSKTEITDEKGQFSFPSKTKEKTFPGLSEGDYTLKVFATGFLSDQKTIHVPGPPEEYEIGLSWAGP